MDKIEKIRQEIERRKTEWEALIEKDNAVNPEKVKEIIYEDMNILNFIDTLSEEPDKSLEEAADNAAIKAFPENKSYSTVVDRVVDYSAIDRKNYRDGFIAGSEWHKQQMMKDAVGGIFLKGIDGEMVFVESSALDIDPKSVRVGDKVKVIVIKEDKE